jgi:alpha-N-arabinofuranosidase
MKVGRVLGFMASVLCLPLGAAAQAPPAPSEVSVSVDLAAPGPRIEPNIYGQFVEHLGRGVYEGIWVGEDSPIPNTRGIRNDVVAALRAIKVPIVRWPGGCFADVYNWRDGVGPHDRRPVRVNTNWGGVEETNAFGTHEYMDLMQQIGAEPYVAGNLGSLGPLDLANWVEYMTSASRSTLAEERRRNGRQQPWTVKYVGFGNEVWGCGGTMPGPYAAYLTRRFTNFVNPAPGQTMVKVASGPTGSRSDAEVYGFTESMMRDGGRFDALAVHWYVRAPKPNAQGPGMRSRTNAVGFVESEWAAALSLAQHMDELIVRNSEVMDRYDPQKRVVLYIDEWGAWHAPTPGTNEQFLEQQNSLRDAEIAALTFNVFHRHTDRVKMAAIAQMVNVLQALILTDKEKMILTPTYWVHQMYMPFQGATPYPATVSGPAYRNGAYRMAQVDVSAARGADGKLVLALVNTDPNRPARVSTALPGRAAGQILTGDAMDAHNTFAAPDRVRPRPFSGRSEGGLTVFDLPARSIAVVRLE